MHVGGIRFYSTNKIITRSIWFLQGKNSFLTRNNTLKKKETVIMSKNILC